MEFIKRERYLEQIRPFYGVDLIKVLTGVRRCGKSVLLQQIRDEFVCGGLSEDHIVNINFEDLQFENIRSAKKLNDYVLSQIVDNGKYLVLLDEIQHVRGFEKTLASLRATQNVEIFITGSNSKLLSGKMASLLVGRCVEFKIRPFSFAESIEMKRLLGDEVNPDEFIVDFVNWGGMPMRFQFSNTDDVKRYLEQTYRGILNKDIITEKSKINRQNFEKIATFVMSCSGKDFSANNVRTYFKANNFEILDTKTVYRYLDKMEKACLIDRVKRFNIVGKKAMTYVEKQYAVDTGFRIVNTNFVNFENTFFLENIVYNELKSRGFEVFTGKIYDSEIDFVALRGNKKCFIQVSMYLNSDKTIEREFGAFDSIRDASPKYVMSLDKFDYSRDGIAHLNLVDFLLGKKDVALT